MCRHFSWNQINPLHWNIFILTFMATRMFRYGTYWVERSVSSLSSKTLIDVSSELICNGFPQSSMKCEALPWAFKNIIFFVWEKDYQHVPYTEETENFVTLWSSALLKILQCMSWRIPVPVNHEHVHLFLGVSNASFHQAHEEWFPCQFFLYPAQQPWSQSLQPQSGNVHCYMQLSSRPCYRRHWDTEDELSDYLTEPWKIEPNKIHKRAKSQKTSICQFATSQRLISDIQCR